MGLATTGNGYRVECDYCDRICSHIRKTETSAAMIAITAGFRNATVDTWGERWACPDSICQDMLHAFKHKIQGKCY